MSYIVKLSVFFKQIIIQVFNCIGDGVYEREKVLREYGSGETDLDGIFFNGGWVMENFPLEVIQKSIFEGCTSVFRDGVTVDIEN